MRQHRPIATNGGDALHVGALLVLISLLLLNPLFADAQPSPKPSTSDDPNNNSDNGYGSFGTTKFNPSMAIVIVVLISAFFFLGFFSIYIRQCGGGDRGGSVRGAAARSRRQQRGLDPDLLVTFPTLVYSEVKGLKIGKGSLECAVCLSEFEDDETLRLLPRCSHVFHHDCIDAWLASHVTCPVCRSNLAETPTAAAESASDPAPEETAVEIAPPEQVAISISAGEGGDGDDREQEMAELARIGSRMRSRSRFPRFPRSHSTGHSTGHSMALAQEKGNLERFTLRLPDDVKKEIVSGGGRFQRAASMRAFPTEGSTRRGYRGMAEGSARGGRSIRLGRSDRWPSFLARTISARFSAFASGKRWESEGSFKKGDGEGSSKGKMSSVRAQFDCLGAGGGGDNEPAARV